MKKRFLLILSVVLILSMTISLFSCKKDGLDDIDNVEDDNGGGSDTKAPPIPPVQKETNADGLIFAKYETYYSVIGYNAPANATNIELTIPSTFKDLPVKSIGSRVFIPSTVYKNTVLKSITVSEGITVISANAFADCSNVTSIVLPSTVTEIGREAFSRCTSLVSVNIPASVISIGDSAFESCYSLQSITVHADNANYQSIDGSLYSKDGNTMIRYAIGNGGSIYTVPEAVTTLARGAFQAASFTEVTIPASVTRIEPDVFKDCTNLNKVTCTITGGWWYSSYSDATSGSSLSQSSVMNKPAVFASKLKNSNDLGKKFVMRNA